MLKVIDKWRSNYELHPTREYAGPIYTSST